MTVVVIALAGVWAMYTLDLWTTSPASAGGGWQRAGDLLIHAFQPTMTYESPPPPGAAPFLLKVARASVQTVVFAAAAISLALVAGFPLGILASTAWWRQRSTPPGAHTAVRLLIAFMRSIHELLWAVLLLTAFGLNDLTAVIAIAIPYAGSLAKVFSEMLDETPTDCFVAFRGIGAGPARAFGLGLLPQALPDMGAYAFYRFECALRSSAVLGFFGFPTLGYYVAASFENLRYGEVWTYLYALIAMVIVLDWWSGAMRKDLV